MEYEYLIIDLVGGVDSRSDGTKTFGLSHIRYLRDEIIDSLGLSASILVVVGEVGLEAILGVLEGVGDLCRGLHLDHILVSHENVDGSHELIGRGLLHGGIVVDGANERDDVGSHSKDFIVLGCVGDAVV